MLMRLQPSVARNVQKDLAGEVDAIARAVRRGIDATARGVQAELRDQVLSSGLRNASAIARAWQTRTYPVRVGGGRPTLHPAALVYSKAPKIILAIASATEIVAHDGRYLTFPTPYNQSRAGAVRVSVGDMVRARGRTFVIASASDPAVKLWCLRGGGAVDLELHRRDEMARALGRQVFPHQRGRFVPMFTLARRVTTRKRLDLEAVRRDADRILQTSLHAALGEDTPA